MKKFISVITLIAILINVMALSVSASTNEVVLTGDILSTVIDVDIPTSASFTINPNVAEGEADRYIMPTLSIINNTAAPVTVTLTGFDNKEGSDNQFIEVARADKEWERLGASNSQKYLYLGLTAASNQESFLNHTDLLSEASADLAQLESKELCHIKAGGTVVLDLECQSGSAFPSLMTSVYDLTFVVSLYSGQEEIVPEYGLITRIVIDSVDERALSATSKDYYAAKDDPTTATITIETETPDTAYAVNGVVYVGPQTMTIATLDWSSDESGLVTVEHKNNGEDVIYKYILF